MQVGPDFRAGLLLDTFLQLANQKLLSHSSTKNLLESIKHCLNPSELLAEEERRLMFAAEGSSCPCTKRLEYEPGQRFSRACLSVLTSEHIQAIRFTHQRTQDATHWPGNGRRTQDGINYSLVGSRQ